jgi:hypothetical protein
MNEKFGVSVIGHATIEDDVDGVILDKSNAIHPANIARIFARALANEPNHSIYRIAFGNGGTYVDATGTVTFRTPNDGFAPDAAGIQSRLYNETYSEVVDESSPNLGFGPGANPGDDGTLPGVRSESIANSPSAKVVITAVLNAGEPVAQEQTSLTSSTLLSDFVFDELGLFSPGLPLTATHGYHDIDIGTRIHSDLVGIAAGVYQLYVTVDTGTTEQVLNINITPAEAPTLTYGQLAVKINQQLSGGVAQVTQPGINTYGRIRIISNMTGDTSQVNIRQLPQGDPDYGTSLLANMPEFVGLFSPVFGVNGGVADSPESPNTEHERLLTHLIFHPLLKAKDRTWTITYTLTITINRTGT